MVIENLRYKFWYPIFRDYQRIRVIQDVSIVVGGKIPPEV